MGETPAPALESDATREVSSDAQLLVLVIGVLLIWKAISVLRDRFEKVGPPCSPKHKSGDDV